MLKEITLKELAKQINILRTSGKVGQEFSFAETIDGDIDDEQTEGIGWHTATKFTDTEVVVRYMGGVCFGLITDSMVLAEDTIAYMENANNYGGDFDENSIVYLEVAWL